MIAGFISEAQAIRQNYDLPDTLVNIVGTLTYRRQLTNNESDVIGGIKHSLAKAGLESHILNTNVPRNQFIANRAGNEIAYLSRDRGSSDIKMLIDALGNEVAKSLSVKMLSHQNHL